ncbi:hypothetical protein G3480_12750 [Thiorhodococcus mannitoliphagus]|uniref:Uncharacterized protein n=1 Tax=Thiorhodococcus mannitoliphagus TaxID=329406 RepID=A0A6P1DYE5_9GAMM|nr:hypothetical protein [Thiorhodococcus mannitoliphagus]NEX21172.1 hypothetical protein [Thiorhodococcus mannitoliphagus]
MEAPIRVHPTGWNRLVGAHARPVGACRRIMTKNTAPEHKTKTALVREIAITLFTPNIETIPDNLTLTSARYDPQFKRQEMSEAVVKPTKPLAVTASKIPKATYSFLKNNDFKGQARNLTHHDHR